MASEWQTTLHGGEKYKVLDDHAGNLTVTEWREQAEEYAEHVCDATGLELLKGIAPKITPGKEIDKITLVRTIEELFKRSTKRFSDSWLSPGTRDNTTTLTTAGGIEFSMRVKSVTEDILMMVKKTLRTGSNAHNHLLNLMRRKTHTKANHLRDFYKYSTTTMIQGAAEAKTAVGSLIKKVQVVEIDRKSDMPNPCGTGGVGRGAAFRPRCVRRRSGA